MRLKASVIAVQYACYVIGQEWRRNNPEKCHG